MTENLIGCSIVFCYCGDGFAVVSQLFLIVFGVFGTFGSAGGRIPEGRKRVRPPPPPLNPLVFRGTSEFRKKRKKF